VTGIVGLQSYRLQLPTTWKIHDVFHISKLTPFVTPKFPSQFKPFVVPELTDTPQIVQSILSHRQLHNKTLYLILLQDQDPENAKWLPEDFLLQLSDPLGIVDAYRQNLPSP